MKEGFEEYYLQPEKVSKENNKFLLNKTELFFDGIFLNDIILRKEFSRLEKQLENFYSINSYTYDNYKNRDISNFLNDNNHRGKQFLPIISSKNHSFHKNENLPKDIDFIQINLEKVCVDYVSIDIIFYFNEEVNTHFNNELRKVHQPEVVENVNESKLQSCSIFSVKDIKKRETKKITDTLRKQCLIFISKYIDLGELYFSNKKNYFDNLPCLNIFSFQSSDKNELLENRDLLDVINFSYNDFETFIFEDKYYLYGKNRNYTLLIDGSKFQNFKVDFSPYGILLDFNLSYISILEYFISLDLKIDKISNNILSSIKDFKKISVEKHKLIDKTIIFDRLSGIFGGLRLDTTEFIRGKKVEKYEKNFDKISIELIQNFISKKSLLINKTVLNVNSLFELESTNQNISLQKKMKLYTFWMFIFVIIQVFFIKYNDTDTIGDFILNLF